MKKLITEDENEGLLKLMGENIMAFGLNYIYTGKLVGVNETCILLENPRIVYETGRFDSKEFKDAQALPFQVYVMLACIESFGKTDKR
jgi:hypothetical protein